VRGEQRERFSGRGIADERRGPEVVGERVEGHKGRDHGWNRVCPKMAGRVDQKRAGAIALDRAAGAVPCGDVVRDDRIAGRKLPRRSKRLAGFVGPGGRLQHERPQNLEIPRRWLKRGRRIEFAQRVDGPAASAISDAKLHVQARRTRGGRLEEFTRHPRVERGNPPIPLIERRRHAIRGGTDVARSRRLGPACRRRELANGLDEGLELRVRGCRAQGEHQRGGNNEAARANHQQPHSSKTKTPAHPSRTGGRCLLRGL
jgi:hypothetical protein